MDVQPQVTSLFSSACQDVAMCGHNASPITLCELFIHTVAPIPGGHTEFMLLIPHSSRSGTTLLLLFGRACLCLHAPRVTGREQDWVGTHGMQMKTGDSGQGVSKIEWGDWGVQAWLAWPLAHQDHSSISVGGGVYAPSSSTPTVVDQWAKMSRDPPTAAWWPQPLPPTQM